VGGNVGLIEAFPGLVVYGGRYDSEHSRIPGQTRGFQDREIFDWGGERCVVREVPGHTLGHILYHWSSGAAFVGDTLFVGGCGRLFEGTAQQLDRALNEVISSLDPETRLFCGHEYTQSNLRFARHVDPSNRDLIAYAQEVDRKRAEGVATVPSVLADELRINPFLRCDTEAIRAAVGLGPSSPRHAVLGALRSLKDDFRA
jgi:hydroxyacylglutathione hydrolase